MDYSFPEDTFRSVAEDTYYYCWEQEIAVQAEQADFRAVQEVLPFQNQAVEYMAHHQNHHMTD